MTHLKPELMQIVKFSSSSSSYHSTQASETNQNKKKLVLTVTPWFMGPRGPMPHSQWLFNNLYLEPNQSNFSNSHQFV